MTEQIEVGQRWVSRDPRDHDRTVTVIEAHPSVNEPGSNGFVVVMSFRRSTMRVNTLRRCYRLAQGGPR